MKSASFRSETSCEHYDILHINHPKNKKRILYFLFPIYFYIFILSYQSKTKKHKEGQMHMKQNISLSWLPIRLGIFILLLLILQLISAQENNDRISIEAESMLHYSILEAFTQKRTTYSFYTTRRLEHVLRFLKQKDIYKHNQLFRLRRAA